MSKESKKVSKLKQAFIAGAITLAVLVGTSIVSEVATYPTEAHRQNAIERTALDAKIFSGDADASKIIDSPRYKELNENSLGMYTSIVGLILIVLQFVVTIILIGYLYRFVRSRRITKSPAWVTTGIYMIATIISTIALYVFDSFYISTATASVPQILFTAFAVIVFGSLVTYLIARIFEWRYNRKHSFLVE